MSRWYIYILRCRDKSLYTGITTNIEARLLKHNAGKGAAYTRSRKPVVLVWAKACRTESYARKQEALIKQWPKARKEELVRVKEKSIDALPKYSYIGTLSKESKH